MKVRRSNSAAARTAPMRALGRHRAGPPFWKLFGNTIVIGTSGAGKSALPAVPFNNALRRGGRGS